MSIFDWSFLDPVGRAIIVTIEAVISLSAITSLLSLSAALVATWVMQVTTHQAGLELAHCPVGAGAANSSCCARNLSAAQCRDAVHHPRPALARQSAAGCGDHCLSAGLRPIAYSRGEGTFCGGCKSRKTGTGIAVRP